MAKLEAKLRNIVDSIAQFFSGKDILPFCDSDIIAGCERELDEAETESEAMKESLAHLSWALVHSKRKQEVQRGITLLQALLPSTFDPIQKREKLYLLAVGYYRSGDYSGSMDLVDECLSLAPDWREALTLKKAVEDRITKDGIIGLGIAATAVGLIVAGIAATIRNK